MCLPVFVFDAAGFEGLRPIWEGHCHNAVTLLQNVAVYDYIVAVYDYGVAVYDYGVVVYDYFVAVYEKMQCLLRLNRHFLYLSHSGGTSGLLTRARTQ